MRELTLDLKRYDIVLVDFGDDVLDGEQGGIRPGLIIQNDVGNYYSGTTIVMPLSTKTYKNRKQPTHTLLKKGKSGLRQDSLLLGECMRQISEKRIIKYIGKVTDEMEKYNIKQVYLANFGE
ncbi:type II toxin-antitoxin system PemK/MazF family toxin [Kineothrix sedimenti]|uniref:Type II toxin-antitoxin system PemK/MazF family toxin n=1 Tax=Kineothrix sedimenti TaxID=3123317 RepID=A0ABZ3F036_9FIRM